MGQQFFKLCGWINDPEQINMFQNKYKIESIAALPKMTQSGASKTVLLHKIYEAATGRPFPVWKQEIGDCVSFGYALAVSILMAVQKAATSTQEYLSDAATEPVYGGSRIEIGNHGKPENPNIGDGSYGIWAAEWIKEYGILFRQLYQSVDLSSYSGTRAKNWGWQGVPDFLEPIAREHPVQEYALVTSYEDARDAIANGYPVPVCSNQGFRTSRDTEGFARPYGTWAHCMCFVACDDTDRRPGLLCCNSWGRDWIDGPKKYDQPDGSFWVDATVADGMLRYRDSYAISHFKGFAIQNMEKVMQQLQISF